MKPQFSTVQCKSFTDGCHEILESLLHEERLDILVNGDLYCSTVCTPTEKDELVLGRLLSDGLISDLCAIRELTFNENGRIAYVSCVIETKPKEYRSRGMLWAPETLEQMYRALQDSPLYTETHSAHTALLLRNNKLLCMRDDIGRHNAVDKVLGFALLHSVPLEECILFSTGRLPTDMVDKALHAGVGALGSKALPTAESVERARTAGLTLLHISPRKGILQFS